MEDISEVVPRLTPGAGVQRVGGRMLAAGAGELLHVFEDAEGEASVVAERILELVDGRRTVAEIARTLTLEFEVDPGVCARDTADFVQRLADQKLLVLGR